MTSCVNDDDSRSVTIVNVGDSVPEFSLSGSDGSYVTSSSLVGRVFILNFFDTGCPDCREEFLVLQQIYDKYGASVPVLNVPRSQSKVEVQAYWDKTGLSMPFFMAVDEGLYYKFATRVIPRTYVVDASGKVCASFTDSPVAAYETLDSLLQQSLGDTLLHQGDVRLSLRLKVPSLVGYDDYYFHNEYTISRLEVWFFDAVTKKFFTKKVVTGLTKDDSRYDSKYDITYLFSNIRLQAGVYDIFTIANYEHAPDEVADESELLNMVDSITYKEGIEANMPGNGPVMTNCATSLLAVDLTPWMGKSYVLSVEMERVMAKLLIGVSQNVFQLKYGDRKYADINITNYKLVNLNRQYYLFQHRDSLSELGQQPEFTMPYHYSEYSDTGELYVVDPLFYKKTLNASDAVMFNSYYRSWFGNFTTEDFASMPSADNHGYAYILENTSFKTSQKNGYSPGIVFKAAVNPVFVYLYDDSQKTLKEEYRPEYWPKAIYLYKYNFYGSIQAINVSSGLTLDELETYSDAQLEVYGIKQCKFNMGVYETYYTYWIQHRRNSDDMMGPMEYGIVRNNFYKMIVTGITGIGNSTITPKIMRDNSPNSYADVVVGTTGE